MTGDSDDSVDAPGGRAKALDALRGLAALNVVALHFLAAFWSPFHPGHEAWSAWRRALEATPLAIVWAGDQAVLLFFVLSGFALTRMLDDRSLGPGGYLLRRLFRIWVPYVASLALALLALDLVPPRVMQTSAWLPLGAPPPTSEDLVSHLLLVGRFDTFRINGPVWSLVHEMRLSLVFPLVHLSLRRFGTVPVLLVSLSLAAWAVSMERPPYVPGEYSSLWRTLDYQCYFVAGAAVARHEGRLRATLLRIPPAWQAALVSLALVLYSDCVPLVPRACVFLGCILLVMSALAFPRVSRVLHGRRLQALGRISYSLYLTHRIVQMTLVNLLYPTASLVTVTLVALPAALATATVMQRFVEAPANALGRRLASRPG